MPNRGPCSSPKTAREAWTSSTATRRRTSDAVAARTLPRRALQRRVFHARIGPQQFGGYTEIPDDYQEVMDRLARKHKQAAEAVPAPDIRTQPGATVGIISLGGCDSAVREAVASCKSRASSPTTCASGLSVRRERREIHQLAHDQLRRRAKPRRAAQDPAHRRNTGEQRALRSILVYGGFPLSARHVVDARQEAQRRPDHGLDEKADRRSSQPHAQQARARRRATTKARCRRSARVRTRLGHRRHRARVLRAFDRRRT